MSASALSDPPSPSPSVFPLKSCHCPSPFCLCPYGDKCPPGVPFYASVRRGLGHDGGGGLSGKRAPGLKGHRTGTNNHVTLVCTKIQRSWTRNTVAASSSEVEQRYSRGPTLTSRSSSASGKDSPGKSNARHLRPSACLSVTLETSLHLTLLLTLATNHPLHIQR